jgi:hypothetical protein
MLALGLGCSRSPSASTPDQDANDTTQQPPADEQPAELGVTKDGRIVLSFSDKGFSVKGTRIVIGMTTKAELEKILGPMDRVIDRDEVDQIGFWDSRGLRAYFPKRSGRIDYFDCVFAADSDDELDPRKRFDGVFKVDGIELSETTTKATLQDGIKGKIHDHASNLPGFSISYLDQSCSFELSKDRARLEMVRVYPR